MFRLFIFFLREHNVLPGLSLLGPASLLTAATLLRSCSSFSPVYSFRSYEGAVDLEKITDACQRQALEVKHYIYHSLTSFLFFSK